MNIPVYLSVAKASALVNTQTERTRRMAADDWNHLRTVTILIRPFMVPWFLLLHSFRRVWLFGCYFALWLAWTTRVTMVTLTVGFVALFIAWFNGAFDSQPSSSYFPPADASTPSPNFNPAPSPPAETSPPESSGYTTTNSDTSPTDAYSPGVPPEMAAELSREAYDFTLRQKMVSVHGYTRDGIDVQPYDRRPPEGFTLEDKTEATEAAVGAVALLYGGAYLIQKYDRWNAMREIEARKKVEEEKRAEEQAQMQQFIREVEEYNKQQKKKPWLNW